MPFIFSIYLVSFSSSFCLLSSFLSISLIILFTSLENFLYASSSLAKFSKEELFWIKSIS
ncbi:hypothetical protein MSU_0681 [Mycoplasma suis str. Illinois]|uniref:Uncharacterized protein n=1 Tax=Mycoplasma suis (strain Illinois) TaxID=768700 RepID=F0QRU2_MYCSL|nr:hypothetical protein MSU_0681 [Mycoplasma suis str. Illinois]